MSGVALWEALSGSPVRRTRRASVGVLLMALPGV